MKLGILFCMLCVSAGYAVAGPDGTAPGAAAGADDSMARQCALAYRRQDLDFVLAHCPEEAWALARAQCEREPDKVQPAYVEFCNRFYNGTAPTYGR